MAQPWSFVSKITNSKHQITNKSQIPNSKPVQSDCFIVWDFEFRSRAAQALAPRVDICPSTWLRVVSLSNHLIFSICYLKFQ